jgi:hypothetical protein
MAFSQATITSVAPPVYMGFQVALSWTSSSPIGTWFQIYVNRSLAWWGTSTSARIAIPNVGPDRVDIGTVDAGEEQIDFSSSLPGVAHRRAKLSWLGGSFEAPDIAGFRVFGFASTDTFGAGTFGGGSFGGDVDWGDVLNDQAAYPGGIATDGFGFGGFGVGGFGTSAGLYSWTSESLTRGHWAFVVAPYDVSGNVGDPRVQGIDIVCPPLPPAIDSLGRRLEYVWNDDYGGSGYGVGPFGGAFTLTLNWLASPG